MIPSRLEWKRHDAVTFCMQIKKFFYMCMPVDCFEPVSYHFRMNKLKRVAEHLLVVFNPASTHLLMTPTRPVCNFDVHSVSLIERNRFLLIHQIDYWIKSISFDRWYPTQNNKKAKRYCLFDIVSVKIDQVGVGRIYPRVSIKPNDDQTLWSASQWQSTLTRLRRERGHGLSL